MTCSLAELYQQAGVSRPPAFAPFVTLDKKPFESQVQGLTLCLHKTRFGLLDETGAGKSIPAVAAALYYIGHGNKALVVTKASLIYQFAESVYADFRGVDRYVRVHVMDQPPDKRRKLFADWDAAGDWPEMVVMSYELFSTSRLCDVMKATGYDVLITDESQHWKNPKSQVAKRIVAYVGAPDETAFIPMTGTPTHTALTDCYMLLRLLNPDYCPNYDAFERRHCLFKKIQLKVPRKTKWGVQTHFQLLVGYRNHKKLSEALYTNARRVMKRDIPELAALKDPVITEVPVRLSAQHMKLYRELLANRFLQLDGDEVITALQEQELRQRALQIITCPEAFVPSDVTIENAVLKACYDLIEREAPASKVLLFLNFRDTIRRYAEALAEFDPVIMNGDVTPTEREVSRDRFLNDPKCRLLIAHPKSAGAGFNFQSVSHTVIYGEPVASPGDFKQSMDRVVRPGQVWECNIYVIKALSTVAPQAIKAMLARDTDSMQVLRDRTSLRHFYNFA